MDIQSQVAARRAELAKQAKQAAADEAAIATQRRQAEKQQRVHALDAIASELSQPDVTVVREGEELALVHGELPALDIEGLKKSKVESLINREARRLWTPWDNWLVISCIIGGIVTLHLAGFGLIPLVAGFWRRSVINKRYRAEIRCRHPALAAFAS